MFWKISEFTVAFIYTSMFFHERTSMSFCNFISQEMGLDRGAQDAFGSALKSCGFGNFDPKSTTFNGWKPQITHIKRKNHLPNPSFCMSTISFQIFRECTCLKGPLMFRSFQHQFPAVDGGIVQPLSTVLALKISIQFVCFCQRSL